jgi:hypothetical protein
MAASDHLSVDQHGNMQLPMFVRAPDLVDNLTGTIDRATESVDEVMDKKQDAAMQPVHAGHGGGVYASVSQRGVESPVQLVHGTRGDLIMGQGHHRTASADAIARTTGRDMWLPVIHTDARESSHHPLEAGYAGTLDAKYDALDDYQNWSNTTPAAMHNYTWSDSPSEWDEDDEDDWSDNSDWGH